MYFFSIFITDIYIVLQYTQHICRLRRLNQYCYIRHTYINFTTRIMVYICYVYRALYLNSTTCQIKPNLKHIFKILNMQNSALTFCCNLS